MKYNLRAISSNFSMPGEFVIAVPYGTGHINDTFQLTFDQSGTIVHYILQRVNHNVFREPEKLMENFAAVSRHIAKKIRSNRETNPSDRSKYLQLITTKDNKNCYKDSDGNYFRCYCFVENARSYDIIETENQALNAAKAFGKFQLQLADLPERLYETIPNFHNTPMRLKALKEAAKLDAVGRLSSVAREYDFILQRSEDCNLLASLNQSGELREFTTHNDTKLNNVLLDDVTGDGCCVIDLDTVMPGLPHYDFGDMIRTGTSPAAEDEKDISKVTMRFNFFEALLRGYLSEAGKFLNPLEKSLLPFSGKLITLEIGIRFLTDYLEGDKYFKIHRPEHNLDRCRTQIALVESIESQLDKMNTFCESL